VIVGIGTDICQVSRVEKLLDQKNDQFIERILTPAEQEKYITASYLAKRYAAKEACAKALGCGIGEKLSFQDIEIINNDSGKPYMRVKGHENIIFHLSMSDEQAYAIAMVVAERNG
jgi:holo-[acyl-carrier protein] synthase